MENFVQGVLNNININIDGNKNVQCSAVNFNGNNYIKLRDIEKIIDGKILFNEVTREIKMSTFPVRFFTPDETNLLERIIMCEAGGEGLFGQLLVGFVIINRTNDSSFPITIKEVIYQKNQFSPVSSGKIDTIKVSDEVKEAVKLLSYFHDESKGATYFRTVQGAEGSWHDKSLTKLFSYKNHYFYK